MTPSPETQGQALRRTALETIRLATERGVPLEALRERLRERRQALTEHTRRRESAAGDRT
jgi:aspartate/tyrosine/aromatic aminotransferase